AWVKACDDLKIEITSKGFVDKVDGYRRGRPSPSNCEDQSKRHFSQEAFVDAIVEFIVGDDQAINVIENPRLRAIFLMLRKELREEDIPHRTTIRARIIQVWEEHLEELSKGFEAFMHILERLSISHKIGWITMDNASNNDTFMARLEVLLTTRGIPFDRVKRRV
ncbi:hypothetical protein FIBSPDRAFT_663987, partial [Athelia psychrophila]